MRTDAVRTVNSIGFLIFPGMLQLDFTGAYAVFGQIPGVTIRLIGKTGEPVVSSDGLPFAPTDVFAADPSPDILVVPGGAGVSGLMADGTTLSFLRRKAESAAYTASVCTGALVLGAAGLLAGRRATTHWQSIEFLESFGATPIRERVVFDGNVATAAGVTSGIDLALALTAKIRDEETARTIQLGMEYRPETIPDTIRRILDSRNAARRAERKKAVAAAAEKLRRLREDSLKPPVSSGTLKRFKD